MYYTEASISHALLAARDNIEHTSGSSLDYSDLDSIDGCSHNELLECCIHAPIAADVIYLADGSVEKLVDLKCRLVLSSDKPNARPICNALKDICSRITGNSLLFLHLVELFKYVAQFI